MIAGATTQAMWLIQEPHTHGIIRTEPKVDRRLTHTTSHLTKEGSGISDKNVPETPLVYLGTRLENLAFY